MTVILLYSFVPLFATNLCATSFCTIRKDSSQNGKLSINQKMIGDVILYGIFPITFGLLMSMSLIFVFNLSWFKSGKWDIAKFCLKNYGVTFPMMEKISVKGSDMHPVYQLLTKKNKNGYKDSSVNWNFQKYLINENGYLEKIISPRTKPDDPSVIEWIKT